MQTVKRNINDEQENRVKVAIASLPKSKLLKLENLKRFHSISDFYRMIFGKEFVYFRYHLFVSKPYLGCIHFMN